MIQWIKIRTDIFDDEKIKLIEAMPGNDTIIVLWVKLLALAGRCNASGVLILSRTLSGTIPITDEMLASIFHRSIDVVRSALDVFESFGMIHRGENIAVTNWEKHQNEEALAAIRKYDATRKRIQRERQRGNDTDLSGLVRDNPVTVRTLDIRYKTKTKSIQDCANPENQISPPEEEPKTEPLGAYPKAIFAAWTELGDKVIQPASDIAFLSTYSRDISPCVKGIHSDAVLSAIRSFGEIIRAPPGTYYWTARVTVGQFFQKHLDKFLPANFNPRDFRQFDAEDSGESIEDRIKRIRREGT